MIQPRCRYLHLRSPLKTLNHAVFLYLESGNLKIFRFIAVLLPAITKKSQNKQQFLTLFSKKLQGNGATVGDTLEFMFS